MTEKTPAIPSPCIAICTISPQTGLCEGCWRTLDEIAVWSTASETVKKAIWVKIHERIQQQGKEDKND